MIGGLNNRISLRGHCALRSNDFWRLKTLICISQLLGFHTSQLDLQVTLFIFPTLGVGPLDFTLNHFSLPNLCLLSRHTVQTISKETLENPWTAHPNNLQRIFSDPLELSPENYWNAREFLENLLEISGMPNFGEHRRRTFGVPSPRKSPETCLRILECPTPLKILQCLNTKTFVKIPGARNENLMTTCGVPSPRKQRMPENPCQIQNIPQTIPSESMERTF